MRLDEAGYSAAFQSGRAVYLGQACLCLPRYPYSDRDAHCRRGPYQDGDSGGCIAHHGVHRFSCAIDERRGKAPNAGGQIPLLLEKRTQVLLALRPLYNAVLLDLEVRDEP